MNFFYFIFHRCTASLILPIAVIIVQRLTAINASFLQSISHIPLKLADGGHHNDLTYNPIIFENRSPPIVFLQQYHRVDQDSFENNRGQNHERSQPMNSGFLELRPSRRVPTEAQKEEKEDPPETPALTAIEPTIQTTEPAAKTPGKTAVRAKRLAKASARPASKAIASSVKGTPKPTPIPEVQKEVQEKKEKPKAVSGGEILDEYLPDDENVQIQQGERYTTKASRHPRHYSLGESPPTFDEDETLKDFYEEWLEYITDQMKGPTWTDQPPEKREMGVCSANINLKDRGCALLVPTCTNYSAAGDENAWSCEMAVWKACGCSTQYTSFLRFLIPKAKECYGDVLHTNDLAALIPRTDTNPYDRRSQALVPVGRCAWSGFFVVYWCVIGSFIIALISALWPVLREKVFKRQAVTTLTAAPSRVFASRHPSTLGSARKLQVD